MKISIGYRIQEGAFGGGNQFAQVLAAHLQQMGHSVYHDLSCPDLDIILFTEPDRALLSCAYDHHDIIHYLRWQNPRALVVHRLNNTSQARDDAQLSFNQFRLAANRVADYTVFVSQWVYEQYAAAGYDPKSYAIVYNGGNRALWQNPMPPPPSPPLKIVTHHWSTHKNKGHEIYQALDRLLDDPQWRGQLEFTFIGRLPPDLTFKNTRHLPPLHGAALAQELHQHHIYLTASQYEAGPNHCIEGALCGLPLLYIESGAMPEYSAGYGIGFTPTNFEQQLARMVAEYPQWAAKMGDYPFTDTRMVGEYTALFEKLLAQAEGLRAQRHWQKSIPRIHTTEHAIQWLEETPRRVLPYLKTLQEPQQEGRFYPATLGLNAEGERIQLPFSAFAFKTAFMLGENPSAAWIAYLLRFQVKGNPLRQAWGRNAFLDAELVRQVAFKTKRLQRLKERLFFPQRFSLVQRMISAETKQAIATLAEVGARTPQPYKGFPQSERQLKRYLAALDWSKPWESGAHLATLGVFYALEAPRFLPATTTQNLIARCTEFVSTLHHPPSGAYFGAKETPPYDELVNGAMKILTALTWFKVPIHTPERLIDTVLAQEPLNEGCHLVDAVYVLHRCWEQTKYREADIQAYLLKLMNPLIAHYNPLDGGFSYHVGRSQPSLHGVQITHGYPISDIHGTTLLVWASLMILQVLKGVLPPPLRLITP